MFEIFMLGPEYIRLLGGVAPYGRISIRDNPKGPVMYTHCTYSYNGEGVGVEVNEKKERKKKRKPDLIHSEALFFYRFLGEWVVNMEDEGNAQKKPGKTERMTMRRVRK